LLINFNTIYLSIFQKSYPQWLKRDRITLE
jgi:hypothetical protein